MRNGHIKRVTDPDIQSSVLEIMGTNVSTNYINAPLDPKKTLCIKLPFLVMIIKNVSNSSYNSTLNGILTSCFAVNSWRNISPSRSRSSMTRTSAGVSVPRTTRALPVSSPSFALCPWDSMRAGIRFSSTCPISQDVLTVPTTSKPWGKNNEPILS